MNEEQLTIIQNHLDTEGGCPKCGWEPNLEELPEFSNDNLFFLDNTLAFYHYYIECPKSKHPDIIVPISERFIN
jgi:hypothetical protein